VGTPAPVACAKGSDRARGYGRGHGRGCDAVVQPRADQNAGSVIHKG